MKNCLVTVLRLVLSVVTFEKDMNEQNLNWRHPWKFTGRPKGKEYSNENNILWMLEDQKKKSSVYTDKEMDKILTDQHEMHDDQNGGGGFTPHDWNQSTTDFPKPEDMPNPLFFGFFASFSEKEYTDSVLNQEKFYQIMVLHMG